MPEPLSLDKLSKSHINRFRSKILDWYDENRRILPWRMEGGGIADPYHIWLSEVMLQQTLVNAAIPYFLKFVKRWPTVQELAAADIDDIMNAWAGLGYYSRARNLHKCAKIISNELDGEFPRSLSELKKLPGIGDYTSAAIAAIAFNEPATVVDGNVERVLARYFAVLSLFPEGKKHVRVYADALSRARSDRPGDFAQAIMDLGATICIPAKPRCSLCPLVGECHGAALGIADTLPKQMKKVNKPHRVGYAYWIEDGEGGVLFQRRPPKGLLGGMVGLPTSEWIDEAMEGPAHPAWLKLETLGDEPSIFHVFTHFKLQLKGIAATIVGQSVPDSCFWVCRSEVNKLQLPTVFKKIVRVLLQD